MKIKIQIIMVLTMMAISNSLFAQDTSHTKLVDKYYPESKAPEQPAPILNKATTEPVSNAVNSASATTTVSQPQQINKTVEQVPASPQVQNTLNPVHTTTNNNDGIGTDNYNPDQASPIYRDTRLGSSSPLYNTYQKNDNGAGAITTNPNKG